MVVDITFAFVVVAVVFVYDAFPRPLRIVVPIVAARADVLPDCPPRGTTRRWDAPPTDAVAARADVAAVVAAIRAFAVELFVVVMPDIFVAARVVVFAPDFVPRATTRRGADNCSVRVITFIGFDESRAGVTPGFNSVRI